MRVNFSLFSYLLPSFSLSLSLTDAHAHSLTSSRRHVAVSVSSFVASFPRSALGCGGCCTCCSLIGFSLTHSCLSLARTCEQREAGNQKADLVLVSFSFSQNTAKTAAVFTAGSGEGGREGGREGERREKEKQANNNLFFLRLLLPLLLCLLLPSHITHHIFLSPSLRHTD